MIEALADRDARPLLVHTGQHYDRRMSEVFFEQLALPEPDRNLGVGSGSHAAQTAALMVSLEELITEVTPSRVVVYGDVNSTIAAALVASKLQIPIAHVEAGLRSFDRTMPEEVNRVVTDALSDLLFTTSPEAADHLRAEGADETHIHFVGNPMIDTLLAFRGTLDPGPLMAELGVRSPYAVATLHRPANVDDPTTARRLVEGLARVSSLLPIVLPLHPRGRAMLESQGLLGTTDILVVDPLDYLGFMSLVSSATLVLTDSGGIQEETTVLGIPCLTLRPNTERPITVTMGTNQLVGSDPDLIEAKAREAISAPTSGRVPPLWDGQAGQRIADVLVADRP